MLPNRFNLNLNFIEFFRPVVANCSAAAATVLAKAVPAIISQPVPSLVHSVCSADAAASPREPSCRTFLGLFSLLPLSLSLSHFILSPNSGLFPSWPIFLSSCSINSSTYQSGHLHAVSHSICCASCFAAVGFFVSANGEWKVSEHSKVCVWRVWWRIVKVQLWPRCWILSSLLLLY